VLVDTFDTHDEEEDVNPVPSPPEDPAVAREGEEPPRDLSDDSTASEEDWSDSSDDDDHALVRTASGHSIVDLAKAARGETKAAIAQSGDDYFSRPTAHAEPTFQSEGHLVGDDEKNAGVTAVEVASPLSDLMDELGIMSPLSAELEKVEAIAAGHKPASVAG
jgi:hypothetical protein